MNPFFAIWWVLSILLTGMGLVSTIQSFGSIEVVSFPEVALRAYREFRDVFFIFFIEWWALFTIPVVIKDIIALYVFCSITVYNYYNWNGNLEEYGKIKTLLIGPLYMFAAIVFVLDDNARKAQPQYFIFYLGHIIAAGLFGIVAIVFFVWNSFAIEILR